LKLHELFNNLNWVIYIASRQTKEYENTLLRTI